MAIYHCSIKIISRGKGKSAVAAAAYRAGEKMINDYDGITHDYTRKGGVVHTEILLPEYAPREYSDRSILWNAVEKIERAKNSQLAREIELALPVELAREQNIMIARAYVQEQFVDKGMCTDICIHDKNDGNPHAHIMLTMRPFEPSSEWGPKSKKEYVLDRYGKKIRLKSGEFKTRKISAVDWNESTKAEEWRAAWTRFVNRALEQQKIETRIDHRSFKRQGLEQIPTVHIGIAASQMEKRGIVTDRGNINCEIIKQNVILRKIKERLAQLKDWMRNSALANIFPAKNKKVTNEKRIQPTMLEIAETKIAKCAVQDHERRGSNMSMLIELRDYLKEHNIETLEQLRHKARTSSLQEDKVLMRASRIAEEMMSSYRIEQKRLTQHLNARSRGIER